MSIFIGSDISKQYLLEENAVEGFKLAVANGQVRLALQILTELVDGIMQIFDAALTDDEESSQDVVKTVEKVSTPVVEEKINVVSEENVEKETEKKATKKTQTKEEVAVSSAE